MSLEYSSSREVTVDQFKSVLERSTLGERRPTHETDRLSGMLNNSDLIITCWEDEHLVGIARSVTDFHYCCYLSDLAVDVAYQKRGIGKTLIARTEALLEAGTKLILLSAPAAVDYYPHIGFSKHNQAWVKAIS